MEFQYLNSVLAEHGFDPVVVEADRPKPESAIEKVERLAEAWNVDLESATVQEDKTDAE